MPRQSQTQAMKEQAALRVTWLGETSALVELRDTAHQARASVISSPPSPTNKSSSNSINVLFNPVLEQHSSRLTPATSSLWNLLACSSSSPASTSKSATTSNTSHAQPTALSKRLEGLPDVHYVFISESDFPNLDVASVLTLVKRDASKFLVPKGWIAHLESVGVPSYLISEFSDWQEETIHFSPNRSLRVTAVPTHSATAASKEAASAKKGSKDRRQAQSAASANWLVEAGEAADFERKTGEGVKVNTEEDGDDVVSSNTTRVFYAGGSSQRPTSRSSQPDTSVEAFFKDLSDRLAPVHLALVPVWAGLSATSNGSSSILSRIFGRKSGSKGKAAMQPECTPAASIDLHRLLKTQVTVALLHGLPNVSRALKKKSDEDDDDESDNKPRGPLETPEARNVVAKLKAACDRSEGRSVEFRRNSLARRGSKGVAGGSKRTSVIVGSTTTTSGSSRRANGDERPPSASRRSSGSGTPFIGQGSRRGKTSFVVLDLGQSVSM